jgi:hypothetical protein
VNDRTRLYQSPVYGAVQLHVDVRGQSHLQDAATQVAVGLLTIYMLGPNDYNTIQSVKSNISILPQVL